MPNTEICLQLMGMYMYLLQTHPNSFDIVLEEESTVKQMIVHIKSVFTRHIRHSNDCLWATV